MNNKNELSVKAFLTESAEETEKLGFQIGQNLTRGSVLGFIGTLGSGKTCMTRGLAKGLGIDANENVNSPTFVLLQKYRGKIPLFHCDVYRMGSKEEFYDLDLLHLAQEGVLVIEWADKFLELLPSNTLTLYFNHVSEKVRRIELHYENSTMFSWVNKL